MTCALSVTEDTAGQWLTFVTPQGETTVQLKDPSRYEAFREAVIREADCVRWVPAKEPPKKRRKPRW